MQHFESLDSIVANELSPFGQVGMSIMIVLIKNIKAFLACNIYIVIEHSCIPILNDTLLIKFQIRHGIALTVHC